MNPMLQRLFLLPLFAMVVMLAVPYSDVAYAGQTNVHRGDTVILMRYCPKWCFASESSGDQIDVCYLDTVFELYSGYHLGQVIEAT